ncbi:protein-disulfide reductase DsbD [Sulfurirhabdus autotrophica]|uniref:Thiol:disulfide interchange protein DsbD n=1 Tax=Sulfurirhabdus autotrophica TaxID=1706046 RepID=A0A4R3Y699_9PROT|nr:protein-disulfide reductase DsbD [Sulfurirhabdus autotrophica]TCV86378.1 thiol:disulfide interchange protein DsbD [Sulfurirhabdus autotrophica]
MKRFFLSLLLCLPLFAHAIVEGELLEPEQAFKFSARLTDAGTIEVRYKIEDGYYLYRDKFKFEITTPEVSIGAPTLPPGKVKQDEYFGKVETYRHDVKITIPLKNANSNLQTVSLKAVSQGCADAGVCYPPITQTAELKLATATPQVSEPLSGLAKLKQLGASLGGSTDEFLPPEVAFKLNVTVKDGNTLLADFKPEPSYYLYRDKISFTLKNSTGISIAGVKLPAGDIKTDPNFGKTEVYHQPFQAVITLKRDTQQAEKVTLVATFQGCSEKGICYPPINKTFNLSLAELTKTVTSASIQPEKTSAEQVTPETAAPAQPSGNETSSESSTIERLFQGGNFWLIISFFFGAGLLLALTPCVFPMIPILSGIIAGQGQHLTKARAFVLSLSYVLGMAITYALVGIAAGLSGSLLSAALQNPWVLSTFALVFVVLAFSMFGFYELQLPSAIQSKFSNASNKMKGGSTIGVFIMGVLSAVIVGPCVAAPLAGALLYIGQTHNVWLGGSALFAMAMGMGVPLILVGVSAGALLPKAGGWMNAVKSFFGVLLIGVAIWLISPVIPTVAHMLLWAALLIVSAIYLKALDPLPTNAHGFAKFWKGVGIITLIAGVAMLIGALSGGRDILQPLSGLRASAAETASGATETTSLQFKRVKNIAELESQIQEAKGKYVMLDFYADWCVSCKEFERFTFSDPRVKAKLKDAIMLQADVTLNSLEDKALLKKFNLFGPPGIIFFDKNGAEIVPAKIIGYVPAEKFLNNLNTHMR